MSEHASPGPSISESANQLLQKGWLKLPLMTPDITQRMTLEYEQLWLWRPDEATRGTGRRRPFILGRNSAIDYLVGAARIPTSMQATETITSTVRSLGSAAALPSLEEWSPNRLVVNKMNPNGEIYSHRDVARYTGVLVVLSCQAAKFTCAGIDMSVRPGDAVVLASSDLANTLGIDQPEHSVRNLDKVRYSMVATQDT